MFVKIIAELNPFSTKRTELTVSPKPIANIINELNTGFPLSQARVCRNGEIIKNFATLASDGDTLWIKFVPYGSTQGMGVGMKVGGWALAIVGAILTIFTGGLGSAIGMAMIGAGLSMTLGGTVLLNINIPSLKDNEKPENDPSIRGAKNQARPHGRIPVLFGRHRVYPDIAANSFTSVIDNSQYFTQLLCGGYKDCVIDVNSIKLGETSIIDLSGSGDINQILSRTDPVVQLEILQNGESSKLYQNCVHEDVINAVLQHQIDDSNGNKVSGEIIRTTPDKTESINVDIFLQNGIGKYNDEGDIEEASVEIKASFKSADDDSPFELLGFFRDYTNVITGAELKTKRYQITKKGLVPGKYTVKIERITPDSSSSKVIDAVYIGSIRSFKSAPPVRAERQKDLTIIVMRVMATSKLNNVIDSFNYIATSKLPVYSGANTGPLYWLNTAETRNPAAMLHYALRGRTAQQQVDPEDIDWLSIEAFFKWCEDHQYFCDAYLTDSVTIAELMRMIGNTARADILRIDSKISVVQDIERHAPVQLFTPKNSKNYSVTMFNADIPDAISLKFIDKDSGYTQNELQVFNTSDGNKIDEPEKIQKTTLWGITDSAQARRIGMYNYAVLKNRPFVHTIEVDIEYLLCNKGDWIQYAGDLALTGTVQGRIKEVLYAGNNCVGIALDEPVDTEPGKQYAVRIRKSNGTVIIKDISIIYGEHDVYFIEPAEENAAPRAGDVYAFGVRGHEVIDLVITDIQPQADLSATLTCVEYSPNIFKVDDPGFVLPEFENKITPVSGAVDSGVINPANNWRLYVTFHDAEEEPPRPSGDGQQNGWHYAHTSSALWQSSKTAESVDAGVWGPPVRIKGERSNTDIIPVYLTLSTQTKILDCDCDGNILTGLLPFTSQAALYKWNHRLPTSSGIAYYPGTGGDLFDPMLGDPVPSSVDIEFSLLNAPAGVSIDQDGLITVSANTILVNEHSITVRAKYHDTIYSTVLFIQVKKRVGEAHYLGTIDTLPQATAQVFILKGPVQGSVIAVQGNYVLAIASGTVGPHTWQAGRVYQWTGLSWAYREPDRYSDLYIRCFKDGLDVPDLTQDMGWFGALFAKLLVAQQAFIEKLATQVIILHQTGIIKSEGFLGADGIVSGFGLYASEGKIEANNAKFRNIDIGGNSNFRGNVYTDALIATSDIPTPQRRDYYSGTKYLEFLGIYSDYLPVQGQYNNVNIKALRRSSTYDGDFYRNESNYFLYAIYENNNEILLAHYKSNTVMNPVFNDMVIIGYNPQVTTTNPVTLGYHLWFIYIAGGATLKLLNIPEVPQAEKGQLFHLPGDNILRIGL